MRTVHINQKAALIAFGSIFFTGFLIFHSVTPRTEDVLPVGHKVLLARDLNARANFQLEKLDLNEGNYEKSEESKQNGNQDVDENAKENIKENIVKENIDASETQKEASKNESAEEDEYRSNFVRQMMIHAWSGYKKYAWGENEVKPIAKIPHNQAIFGGSSSKFAATIVDALDTLWIMKLPDEFSEGRDYISKQFNLTAGSGTISVFETNIRFLGGFLAAYALTNDTLFLKKSKEVGDVLLKAFNTETGIPKSSLNLATGATSNYGWANGGSSILSEIGSLHLEFVYLSNITGDPIYQQKVQKVRDHLDGLDKPDGLYPNYISPSNGQWTGKHVSLGAMGDSFYEYLLKSYFHTNDGQALRMYNQTMAAILQKMQQKSKGGLTYIAEYRNGVLEHKMGHLACFCVGMFALQARVETDPERQLSIMNLAEELGRTCHESYARSPTGLGPEMFYFLEGSEAQTTTGDAGYILRPEVMEGWFYLWRLTKKPQYKQWIWDAVQAIEKHCKKEAGYAGLRNVYSISDGWDDVQQSFFLAETLKYAYLTFMDDSVMSFGEWVFNTEAHALPVLVKTNVF